jgi:hypothetical protein
MMKNTKPFELGHLLEGSQPPLIDGDFGKQ